MTRAVLSEHELSAYDGWCQSQADGTPPNSAIANLVAAYRALKQERDQLKAERDVSMQNHTLLLGEFTRLAASDALSKEKQAQRKLDTLQLAAQQAAQALVICRIEMAKVVRSNRSEGNILPAHHDYTNAYLQAKEAIAALAKVGVTP